MKQVLLTIAIPTFNRHQSLCRILEQLHKTCVATNDDVEILISDNSDHDIQVLNHRVAVEYGCIYHANQINLGFAGNLLNILKLASGDRLWYLSDDDNLCIESINSLLPYININFSKSIIMLPFQYDNSSKQFNNMITWNNANTLPALFKNKSLPFILFSSFIINISLCKTSLNQILSYLVKYSNNDFFQILLPPVMELYSSTKFSISYFPLTCIEYNTERFGRFSLMSLYKSEQEIISTLNELSVISANDSQEMHTYLIRKYLLMALQHKAGLKVILDGNKNLSPLVNAGLSTLSSRNILLILSLLFCPPSILKMLLLKRGHSHVV